MTITARQAARIAAQVESKGIYTVPTAAALLCERPATVRRWAFGYRRRGLEYTSAIQSLVSELQGTRVLTFPELVELMFIQGLLKSGLSWPKLREAMSTAARLLPHETYPFATSRWFHDAAALYLPSARSMTSRSSSKSPVTGKWPWNPYFDRICSSWSLIRRDWQRAGFRRARSRRSSSIRVERSACPL